MLNSHFTRIFTCSCAALLVPVAFAQIDIGTTDASDGNFISGAYYGETLDMSLAPTGSWDQVSLTPGRGVYDPIKWAVVYKFNNVDVNGLSFAPHPSGCPAVILCQGNFSVQSRGVNIPFGVGGFPGGVGSNIGSGSAGLGLGGGQASNTSGQGSGSGSYATAGTGLAGSFPSGDPYGNPAIIPLVGGSGGGSASVAGWNGGSNGGGAILIASRNTVTLNGGISANGQSAGTSSPGSGGAIRIVANVITGNGNVHTAAGLGNNVGYGGQGRIRLEANTFGTWGSGQPSPSLATVGTTAKIWPSNTDPSVKVATVNGQSAPLDPGAPFQSPDVQLNAAGSFTVVLECRNVPIDTTWDVSVRGVPRSGLASVYPCTLVNGNQALSTWSCSVPFSEGLQVIQGRAKKHVSSRPGK